MKKFNVLVSSDTTIKEAMLIMSDPLKYKQSPGFAVIVDENNIVLGAITDGDIRKALVRDIKLGSPVSVIMTKDPIMIEYRSGLSKKQMHDAFLNQMKNHNKSLGSINQVIFVDVDGSFVDVIPVYDLIMNSLDNKSVAIYGLGFVGLTLGLVMANKGFKVTGYDTNDSVISNVNRNYVHFFENGLQSLLEIVNKDGLVFFTSDIDSFQCDIHIVTVGSPIINGEANLSDVRAVTQSISSKLSRGDVVIYRSTLPVGTTRNILIPILESSGLSVGLDFNVVFAPERTVEGNAIEELQSLPQIIGGYSSSCTEIGASIFSKITSSIVEVDELESAELIKLMNNSFRDLVFSFANEVANISDQFNINAFNLISSANKGYPRNPIPLPSPGVGGYCLTKDPYLLASTKSFPNATYKPILPNVGRQINSQGGLYVYNKIKSYCALTNKNVDNIDILIVGISFKGFPETSDIRHSSSLDLINLFHEKSNLYLYDFVVPNDQLEAIGGNVVNNLEHGFIGKDAVIFMNNHPAHTKIDLVKFIGSMKDSPLFFDGWNQFTSTEVERINSCFYSTMGYLSS